MVECTLHMHMFSSNCTEFRDEIPFKGGWGEGGGGGENVRPEKIPIFGKRVKS